MRGEWKHPILILFLLFIGILLLEWLIGTHEQLWTY